MHRIVQTSSKLHNFWSYRAVASAYHPQQTRALEHPFVEKFNGGGDFLRFRVLSFEPSVLFAGCRLKSRTMGQKCTGDTTCSGHGGGFGSCPLAQSEFASCLGMPETMKVAELLQTAPKELGGPGSEYNLTLTRFLSGVAECNLILPRKQLRPYT